jgi:hypothetical protein
MKERKTPLFSNMNLLQTFIEPFSPVLCVFKQVQHYETRSCDRLALPCSLLKCNTDICVTWVGNSYFNISAYK